MIACGNALFAFYGASFLSVPLALGLSLLSYWLTVRRFVAQMRDERRPRWITRYLDTPLFAHFGGTLFALLALPVCALAGMGVALSPEPFLAAYSAAFRTLEGYAYALGLGLSIYAIWIERRFVRVRQIEVEVADLPAEFEGYRIAQLSDLHVGSFDPKARAEQWVAISNAEQPDLAVVTGDLVTSGRDFYSDVADAIAGLSAKDGVFVAMGNHDLANNDELARFITERGPRVLRNSAALIRRAGRTLSVAGIDARFASAEAVTQTVKSCMVGSPIVLLSHYPSTFRAAAAAGADLVLSGHTHGGQLGIPFLSQRFNLARLARQHSRGIVRSGKSTMYVNAGLGTTGPPMRLGVPPEIAIITLRRGG